VIVVNTPPRRPCLTTPCRTLTTRPLKRTARVLVGRSYKHPDAPANADYTQIGILTKSATGDGENIILPLFGKRSDVSRSKYQYYTMSNTGVNTKLRSTRTTGSVPASRCDEIYSGDSVFVDGYDSTFNAKVYETNLRYIPECELSNMAV
jgi:hypothetical protein